MDSDFEPFFGYPGGFCAPDPKPEYQELHAPSNDVESEAEEYESKPADSDSDDDKEYELSTCCECRQVEDPTSNMPILLCDGCDAACHLSCAKDRHKLTKVPDGDWYCSGCAKKGSSGVPLAAVPSKRSAGCRKKRKRNMNRSEAAPAAKKTSKVSSKRDLPTGVRKTPSGNFVSRIKWGGKDRHIDTFDTPEQASAAYLSVKKDRDDTNLVAIGADEVDALFDAAKTKALETVGTQHTLGMADDKRER